MKKINLCLNYGEILSRIDKDKALYGVGEWAKSVGVSINTVSNIHGKSARINPSIEYVVAIARFTRKPIEWYLYGEKSENESKSMSEEEFMAKWPKEIQDACRKLKDILLSDDPVIKPALLSNLAAFQQSLEQKEEIRKLSRRLQFLEERHKAKRHTGTDGAASSSTGKTET
jgi:transcriptional regulator with XRE-family HTH domain